MRECHLRFWTSLKLQEQISHTQLCPTLTGHSMIMLCCWSLQSRDVTLSTMSLESNVPTIRWFTPTLTLSLKLLTMCYIVPATACSWSRLPKWCPKNTESQTPCWFWVHTHKILLAHDICTKHRLVSYLWIKCLSSYWCSCHLNTSWILHNRLIG